MRLKEGIQPKHILCYAVITVFMVIILPLISILLFPNFIEEIQSTPSVKMPRTISLYITEEKKYRKIPFEEYVEGVVASEMPDKFPMEALKAQAVACRTYALGKINAGSKVCDSVHCQVYRDYDISGKIKAAVAATKGQVLMYKKRPAYHSLYFSSSCGPTENSEDVFSSPYPYLKSVSSSYEPGATHKKETLKLSYSELRKELSKTFPSKNFNRSHSIKVTSRSKGGRADTVSVFGQQLSGSDLRFALNLYSARITISYGKKNVIINTKGAGHGVGMSQYGAKGLAKKGYDYRKILSHYYRGTSVSKKQ